MIEHITKNTGVKRQRFVQVVERRVNNILDGLDNLGKCSNKRNYEYNEDEAKKIFREIDKKVKETKLKFLIEGNNKHRFKL